MKATVREYTVKKKVVVVEIPVEVAEDIARYRCIRNPEQSMLIGVLVDALEADRAEEQRKDTEDVPF